MSNNRPILLIGAGNMGQALLKGWFKKGIGPVFVIEPAPLNKVPSSQFSFLGLDIEQFSVTQIPVKQFVACVIAVKPQILKEKARAFGSIAKSGTLMISIAAGTHSEMLQHAWGPNARIVRAMPNTPGAIGEGITGLYATKRVRQNQRRLADELLSALGKTIWVDDEKLIDVVTAVSGSGPAYLFLMAEVLTSAGVAEGLPYDVAAKLARATVSGAGVLLKEDKHAARTLRHRVTSPGGTTEAALKVLMSRKDGLASLMKRAVHAARKRAEELR